MCTSFVHQHKYRIPFCHARWVGSVHPFVLLKFMLQAGRDTHRVNWNPFRSKMESWFATQRLSSSKKIGIWVLYLQVKWNSRLLQDGLQHWWSFLSKTEQGGINGITKTLTLQRRLQFYISNSTLHCRLVSSFLEECVIFITCGEQCADDQIRQSTKEQHISWISRNEVYKLDWYFPEIMSKRGSCPLRGSTCVIHKLIKRCYFCSWL